MATTLITGADGHIGSGLVRWLLEHSDHELVLGVRARTESELQTKRRNLGALLDDPRCEIVASDFTMDNPLSALDAARVTDILHCAAATSFTIDRETAEATNFRGTEKLLEFAARCPRLERVGLVSTIYSAGLREGRVLEQPLAEAEEFANNYEWSKWKSEQLLEKFSSLPWQIYRMSTVLAEDASGRVVRQNVVHNTLRLLFYGLLSIVPGAPSTRVYFVTADFACEAIGRLFLEAERGRIYHVSDDGDRAIRLSDMIDIVYDAFRENAEFAKSRILKPLFCDWQAFETLIEGSSRFGSVISQALDSVAPFAPQLYRDKDVDTTRCTDALDGLRSPEPGQLMTLVSRNLVSKRWGLKNMNAAEDA